MHVRGGDGASSGMTWLVGAVRIEEICRAVAQTARGSWTTIGSQPAWWTPRRVRPSWAASAWRS
eukprot:9377318-Pyramimonas_sp.AAC.1